MTTTKSNVREAYRKEAEKSESKLVDMTPRQKVERVQQQFSKALNHASFMSPLMEGGLKLIDASSDGPSHGRTVWEFNNDIFYANSGGMLHGGMQAALFDMVTSMTIAIIAKKDYWLFSGVSRVLSTTYVRPAPTGEVVLIEAEVVHVGKQLGVLKATMRRKRDGAVISICEHNKVNDSKL